MAPQVDQSPLPYYDTTVLLSPSPAGKPYVLCCGVQSVNFQVLITTFEKLMRITKNSFVFFFDTGSLGCPLF